MAHTGPAPADAPALRTLGREEWVALPELGLPAILAKTDTGARTSALHAVAIEPFGPIGKPLVRFVVHPWPERPDVEVVCSAPLSDRREILSSNGEPEWRFVIATRVEIGGVGRTIEVSLSDRRAMRLRMLLGRNALSDGCTVDPSRTCLAGSLSYDAYTQAPGAAAARGRPLRIALITMQPSSYTVRRLREAGAARGHVVEVLETRRCYMNINAARPEVCYDGRALPHFDAVIARIGTASTSYGAAIVRQFQLAGAWCLNRAEAIAAARDKLTAHQLLVRHHVPTPVTAFARSPDDAAHVIDLVGGAPLVIKLIDGSQGRGVVLAETVESARSVIGAFQELEADILVQEFVAESRGSDVRCLVVGKSVVAAMERTAQPGEFRANLHRGGAAGRTRLSPAEREVAVRAARVMGLELAGVDLLRAAGGPKVLEVNASPGLQGIESVSGGGIAEKIIAHIEQRLRPAPVTARPPRRGKGLALPAVEAE